MASSICCGLWLISGLIMTATANECSGREIICMETPPVDATEVHDITEVDTVNWKQDASVYDQTKFGYRTDEYMVSLQGKVDWRTTDVMGRDAEGLLSDVIGTIPGDYCPTYPAIFTATNEFGLMSSIEIGKAEDQGDGTMACPIFLRSWSLQLLYFDARDGIFWYPDNMQIQNGQTTDWTKLELKGVYADPTIADAIPKTLNDLTHLYLDGITYVRSEALTFMYNNDPATAGSPVPTASPTENPVTLRRRLGEEQDFAYSRKGGQEDMITDLLSSLPLSHMSVLGVCIGITLFVSQALFSKKNAK